MSGFDPSMLVLGLAAASVLLTIVAIVLLSQRRFGRELRDIVEYLEELRTGGPRERLEVPSTSPLALVADSVNRLGHDVQSRWNEASAAAERWRALTDAARDTAIVTTDTDGDIRSFSAGATTLFGWEEDEVLSRPVAVVFEESAYKDLLPKLARRSLRRQGITTRSTMMRKDGAEFRTEISVRMLEREASGPMGFMMVVRDIAAQVELEASLRQSERQQRQLVEEIPDALLVVHDGRLAYANPAAEELFGRRRGGLVGERLLDRIVTPDILLVEEALAAAMDEQAVGGLHCTLRGTDGEPGVAVSAQLTPLEYAGAPAVLLLLSDESEERGVAAELGRNEALLDAVLESTTDGILVLDEAGGGGAVRMSNRAFGALFGLAVSDYLGGSVKQLAERLRLSGGGAEKVADLLIAGGLRGRDETVTLGGQAPRELLVSAEALRGPAGEGLGAVVVCRDRTAERQSEQRLQSQAEELRLGKLELEQAHLRLQEVHATLESRSLDLDRLNQELRRLDEMKSNLLGNVSHELQTPLVSIRGYTEMILKERLGPVTDEQRKGLRLSLTNIDRLIAMIDNLMAFSRADRRAEALKLERFPLRPLLQEAVELLRDKIEGKQLSVGTVHAAEELAIEADRDKILQVFVNLLSNAVRYNRPGGRIEISARKGEGDFANVSVSDTGIGIPQDAIGRIFERNFQVAAGGAAAEGSGLGLSIVRDILRVHGCTIAVHSEPGHGATFSFSLPLASEPVGRDDAGPGTDAAAEEGDRPRLRIIRRHGKD